MRKQIIEILRNNGVHCIGAEEFRAALDGVVVSGAWSKSASLSAEYITNIINNSDLQNNVRLDKFTTHNKQFCSMIFIFEK